MDTNAETLPPLSDLSRLAEAASLAESLLLAWFRASAAAPDAPAIHDLASATHSLWRLTAVRKTLLLLPQNSPSDAPEPATGMSAEEIESLIRRCARGAPDEDDEASLALEEGDPYDGEVPESFAMTDAAPEPPSSPDSPHPPSPAEPPFPACSTSVPQCPSIPAARPALLPRPSGPTPDNAAAPSPDPNPDPTPSPSSNLLPDPPPVEISSPPPLSDFESQPSRPPSPQNRDG